MEISLLKLMTAKKIGFPLIKENGIKKLFVCCQIFEKCESF